VFGIGASAIIAEDLKQKLTRIDKWCEVGKSYDEQATLSANVTKNDVIIAISNTGQTEDILQSLALEHKAGAQIISITIYNNNSYNMNTITGQTENYLQTLA